MNGSHKGRGAASNRCSRYLDRRREPFDDGWPVAESPPPRTELMVDNSGVRQELESLLERQVETARSYADLLSEELELVNRKYELEKQRRERLERIMGRNRVITAVSASVALGALAGVVVYSQLK